MKFLMMIKHTEQAERFQPPQSLNVAMGEFVREGFAKGWLKETAGLTPTSKATRIRSKGGKLTITDGPFHRSEGNHRRHCNRRDGDPRGGDGRRPSLYGVAPHPHS